MAFFRLLSILVVILMCGSGGDEDERLDGDKIEMIITTADGRVVCEPHHNDWVEVVWEGDQAADRSFQRSMNRDYPLQPMPEGQPEWLLMEPYAHEIHQRTRVCLISTLKNKLSIIYAIKTLYIQAIFLGPVISCTFVLLSKYIM